MWNTPAGQRVIEGAEASLIREAVGGIVSQLLCSYPGCEDCLFESGIEVFDCLPNSQKLALIEQAARHLLTDTPNPLPLTAVNESVIGAIFEFIRQQVEIEIDTQRCGLGLEGWNEPDGEEADLGGPGGFSWRQQVLETRRVTLSDGEAKDLCNDDFEWPEADSEDLQRWDLLIESLADRILWDRDYEMAQAFLDDAPENASVKKLMLGIDQDYFTGLAPDPRDEQIEQIVRSIHNLTRSKPR